MSEPVIMSLDERLAFAGIGNVQGIHKYLMGGYVGQSYLSTIQHVIPDGRKKAYEVCSAISAQLRAVDEFIRTETAAIVETRRLLERGYEGSLNSKYAGELLSTVAGFDFIIASANAERERLLQQESDNALRRANWDVLNKLHDCRQYQWVVGEELAGLLGLTMSDLNSKSEVEKYLAQEGKRREDAERQARDAEIQAERQRIAAEAARVEAERRLAEIAVMNIDDALRAVWANPYEYHAVKAYFLGHDFHGQQLYTSYCLNCEHGQHGDEVIALYNRVREIFGICRDPHRLAEKEAVLAAHN